MSVIDRIRSWFKAAPPPPVSITAIAAPNAAHPVADRDYIRLSIAQLRVADAGPPIIQASVRMDGGGKLVELPTVIDASKLDANGPIALGTARLTPLVPFRGGDVSFSLAVTAITAKSPIATHIRTLAGISNLVTVPPFDTATRAAPLIADGIDALIGVGPHVHLGAIDARDATTLADGYIAIVRSAPGELAPARLSVAGGMLQLDGAPVADREFVLLRVEIRADRDDWAALRNIDAPYQFALRSADAGERMMADAYLRVAVAMAWEAPELTVAHRRIVSAEMGRAVAEALAKAAPPGKRDLESLASRVDLEGLESTGPRLPTSLADMFAHWPLSSSSS